MTKALSAFKTNEVFVTLQEAERVVKETKKEGLDHACEVRKQFEKIIRQQAHQINKMKHLVSKEHDLHIQIPLNQGDSYYNYKIGEPTGVFVQHVQLYTGDVLKLEDGQTGFVCLHEGCPMIMTKSFHRVMISQDIHCYQVGPAEELEYATILSHFNTYEVEDVLLPETNNKKGFVVGPSLAGWTPQ